MAPTPVLRRHGTGSFCQCGFQRRQHSPPTPAAGPLSHACCVAPRVAVGPAGTRLIFLGDVLTIGLEPPEFQKHDLSCLAFVNLTAGLPPGIHSPCPILHPALTPNVNLPSGL